MLANSIVDLLIQTSRVTQIHRVSCDIGPAEWLALRFFARANTRSRKASVLADFEASSRAAVSPIIGRLESKGYVRRQQSQDDGRSFDIEVTAAGHAALQNDPVESLVNAVGTLPQDDQLALQTALRKVLANLAMSGVRRRLDICRDCRHLIKTPAAEGADTAGFEFRCELLNVAVDQDALAQLCVRFEPAAAGLPSTRSATGGVPSVDEPDVAVRARHECPERATLRHDSCGCLRPPAP